MLKRVYSKYKDEKQVFKLDKEYTLKEILSLFAIPEAKIGWKGQKKRFKVIARNDNFIIIARPYNPKKTFEYSILDLEYMVCNHDNYYCKYDYSNEKLKGIRDLFKNIKKAYFYRLNSGNKATNDLATAKCSGIRGNDIKIVIAKNIDEDNKYDVSTYLGTKEVDVQTVKSVNELVDNDYVTFKMQTLAVTAGKALAGGTNGDVSGEAHQKFLDKLESYEVNAVGCTAKDESTSNLYVQYAKRMRDEQGIKFQAVVYNNAANYEGVVNVKNTTVEDDSALVYWVTGVIAGCEINKSNTNKTYDGEYTINVDYTQAQLESSIDNGEFILHKVGDEVRVLVDINSLVDITSEKGEEFKSNQTIRVLDQIASDVASVFNSKYLGKIANNEAGRTSLWADIVALFKDYQTLQAIENFEDEDIKVAIGNDKKSVTIETSVQVINAMEKLYMTVVVE